MANARAAKSAAKGAEPAYDVAISFLAADETIAAAIRDGLAGLNVFFYPRNQEDLIGTNGLESMRQPFLDARVVVVLYRPGWGETPWTGVEMLAITDRCLKERFRPLVFVQLEKTSPPPGWLPDTHIRCVFEHYGIDQLIGAIKARVQELGGVIKPPDAMSEARRVQREAEYLREREVLMQNRQWIENVVHESLRDAMREIARLAGEANAQYGFQIQGRASLEMRSIGCVLRSSFVSMAIWWRQPIFNRVGDDEYGECYLSVAEFSGTVLLPGEQGFVMHKPERLKEYKFKVDVSETRGLVWSLKGTKERILPGQLADRIMRLFLDLLSRANQGKVPRPAL